MGIFSNSCDNCGSTEHGTSDCPHGLLSSKCSNCGSAEHSSRDCPHGLFADKCGNCGDTSHATRECPHGLFASRCGNCGSTAHGSSNCPHGLLSGECVHCGSKEHHSRDCPHGLLATPSRRPPKPGEVDEDAADGGGLWHEITEKATMVGGISGAIVGLIIALDSAESVLGFIAYVAIGGFAGAFVASIAFTLLPWALAAGALILLIKACTS